MQLKSIQEYYDDDWSHCYGCGRLNAHGLRLASYWNGDEAVAEFTPRAEHLAFQGHLYGGLIASLMDCHSIAAAVVGMHQHAGFALGEGTLRPLVTASLQVSYLRPTPTGRPLTLRATPLAVDGRKVTVACSLFANGVECARADVLAVMVKQERLVALRLAA